MSDRVAVADEVQIRVEGPLGRITLDRPKAINALTIGMVRAIAAALARWRDDGAVRAILLDGAGERGFCAGGDIRALYEHRGDTAFLAGYWREEYVLDHAIATYPKPIVVLMDGLTMGGGAGLGVNASHRVVSETTRFAMPETGIGMTPDVGASWFLARCPDYAGVWMALTGATIGAGDMIALGLADAFCETWDRRRLVAELRPALEETSGPAAAVSRALAAANGVADSPLAPRREDIRRCFAADTVEGVVAALAAADGEWAGKTADAIRAKSPLMQKVALRSLKLGAAAPDLGACLATEFRIVSRIATGHEFYEGVRAAIIDKDRAPRWRPSELAAVDASMVEAFFAPLSHELVLTPPRRERILHA